MPGTLYIEIVTPERREFRGEALGFKAPSVDGGFEVLHNHAPMLAVLDIGTLSVTATTGERILFVTSGGFVEVLNNHVIVLAETAEPVSGIDLVLAREAEAAARERLKAADAAEREVVERELQVARNRVRAAIGRPR